MTDWGAHHNDIARWAIGLDGPSEVEGKPLADLIPGGYTAFSEYEVKFTYANGVIHTARTTKDDNIFGGITKQDGQRNGIRFEGSNGWLWVNRGELDASDEALYKTPLPENAERLYDSPNHMANLFDCVRSRKAPIAEAEVGHRSASVCHIGVIALRLGQSLKWDPRLEEFIGEHSKEANRWLAREMRKPYDYGFIG